MEQEVFEEEKVSSLSDLQTKLQHYASGFTEVSSNDCISCVIIDLSDLPNLLCCVKIFHDLTTFVVVADRYEVDRPT